MDGTQRPKNALVLIFNSLFVQQMLKANANLRLLNPNADVISNLTFKLMIEV